MRLTMRVGTTLGALLLAFLTRGQVPNVILARCAQVAKAPPAHSAPAQTQPNVWPRETDEDIGAAKPKEIPRRWRGLIGEYGPEQETLYILERGGRLCALFGRGKATPLEEVSGNVFEFSRSSPYEGKRLVFKRDAQGRAIEATTAGVSFKRRQVGPAQGSSQLRVKPLLPVAKLLKEAMAEQPPKEAGEFRRSELVELVKLDPTIKLDIRYATTNNFLGAVFYAEPRAFLQRPAAEAVMRANRRLRELGYGLLVHDAYRPWYVTKTFWDATPPDKKWLVANPTGGSKHNRGAAVDLTLYDLRTGRPVEMPSTYDESTDRAYAFYPGGTSLERWHRALLRRAMEDEGFTVNPREWWHFDYKDWQRYPIGNVPFDQIG